MPREYRIVRVLKKNKKLSFLLLLIIASGIFLRVNDFAAEGYSNDDASTIPTGLLFFYTHSEYPGLLTQGEPALGNLLIGASCRLSDEDFSNVTMVQKNFFVGRDALLGAQMIRAIPYCHLPMYIFGILFLLIIIVLSLSLLGLRPTLFVAAFFSYSPFLLRYSRWLHVDIIFYTFAALGLLLLWEGYRLDKGNKKEIIFFILAFVFFALALATKLPAALFFIIGMAMIIYKYKLEVLILIAKLLNKLDLNIIKIPEIIPANLTSFIKIVISSSIAYFLALLPPFEFKIGNLFAVIQQYRTTSIAVGGFGLTASAFQGLKQLLYKMNFVDFILFFFAIIIFIKLLFKKNKKKNEIFIVGLMLLIMIFAPFSKAFMLPRVLFVFLFGLIFLMALFFSEKGYLFQRLRKRNLLLLIMLLIYIIFQFSISYSGSPYFYSKNHLLCALKDNKICHPEYYYPGFSTPLAAEFLNEHLEPDETYFAEGHPVYYYVQQGYSYYHYGFRQEFRKQTGREPTIYEYIEYMKPFDKPIRYVLLFSKESEVEDLNDFKSKYIPNYNIKIRGTEVIWIYDVQNLQSK